MSKLKVTTDIPNEITMTRTFDAPRRLVLKAMSSPELLKRWLGGVRATVLSVEVDFRVDGPFRYEFRTYDGFEFAIHGVYKEVSEDRTVHIEQMDCTPGQSLVTTTFSEANGVTTMTLTMRFESQQMRDEVAATGMADGAGECYDVLAILLRTL